MKSSSARMIIRSTLCGLFLSLTTMSTLIAQEKTGRMFDFVKTSEAPDTIRQYLKASESKYLRELKTPHFLLMNSDHNLAFGIGGAVELDMMYDFHTATNDDSFQPGLIPVPYNPMQNSEFQISAYSSKLFFQLVGHNAFLKDFNIFIDFNFSGGHFKLRNAYFTSRGFLLGQAWSTFTDLAAIPPSTDPNEPGKFRVPQIRYTHTFGKNIEAALGIEMPKVSATYDSASLSMPQRIPNIPFYVQYQWNQKKSHLRASAVLRTMTYRDTLNHITRNQLGWEAKLSSSIAVTKNLQLYGEVSYGEGNAAYVKDTQGADLDLLPNPGCPGKLQAPPIFAFFGGVKYDLSKKLYVSGTYSQVHVYSDKGWELGDQYKIGQLIQASLFWQPTDYFEWSMEYLYARRTNNDRQKNYGNRIKTAITLKF